MHNPLAIYLFDLDGVLITPGGYNAAPKAAVNHFAHRMGLAEAAPDDSAIETFAVHGIGREWDSGAICLGALMLELWKADRGLRLAGDFAHMLSAIAARSPAQPDIDYKALALRVAHATPPGGHAPLAALRLLSDEANAVERGERVREMEDALRLLLGGTRDAHTSPTRRVIQHFTLGSSLYTEVYRQPAQFETGSLLREFDRPTLSEAESRVLESSMRREGRRAAAYTLRLSRPLDLPTDGAEFAPEAEIALETAGVAWLPLVGYGHVRWLAARHGAAPDAFGKPSPVHALAALGRAVGGGERESLEAAFDLWESGQLNELLRGMRERPLTLHVFEDSSSSVRGVCEAARLLRVQGFQAECRAYGIASSPEREAALRESGIAVHGGLEPALRAAGL
jgi:hypothetical protein